MADKVKVFKGYSVGQSGRSDELEGCGPGEARWRGDTMGAEAGLAPYFPK